jgi:anti-sigma regulatory factor (Ser/Thr protein kinase)
VRISYTLTLPAEVASVPMARSICQANLSLLTVSQRSIDDVTLALTEACGNVVRHAAGRSYQVRVSIDEARCVIEVIENGSGIPPEPDPDELLSDGRGLLLMGALVDQLAFTRREDSTGTVVCLEKRLDLDPGSPLAEKSRT